MTVGTAVGTGPGTTTAGQEADTAMALQLTCPKCGAKDLEADQASRFCEQCGYELAEAVTGDEEPGTEESAKPCVSCGGTGIDAEGYCTDCGDLQPRRRDRMEVDFKAVAGVSDRGLRHHRNEDSMALGPAFGPDGRTLMIAVVCDGVSTSERPDEASASAVKTAAKLLLAAIAGGAPEGPGRQLSRTGPVETAVMETVPDTVPETVVAETVDPEAPVAQSVPTEPSTAEEVGAQTPAETSADGAAPRRVQRADLRAVSRQAVIDADHAVSGLARDADHGNPPACTYVSAVVDTDVTLAWLGDSRAYWLDERGTSRALTRDDAEEGSHAIEAWLGADSGGPEPHLASFTPDGPGVVLVCSDGLWNYVEKAADLAAIALPGALTDPFTAAKALVRRALSDGGHDNITAVLVPYPVQPPAEGVSTTGVSRQP
ncbi:protein phosphatase 2C domain-containing protein [Catenulispora sp. NF23]|uniref:Protein phosphatase 2C domain-containing protein n=1 Tax=Catenulispora pinistramenti TaxID=2705254 RepID=A0ABS5L1V6_9ACTN|nr:protein phosphatase 2C domain-containing protein [Catenulispora pinistramenti]MBS2535866.1 protein phosphatase 2C domain-containing protein [Catenulispora pinistramenti]MBS2552311.1 protein phosphatase 2C domain-containing protein [Catenulispora pinistramenti]